MKRTLTIALAAAGVLMAALTLTGLGPVGGATSAYAQSQGDGRGGGGGNDGPGTYDPNCTAGAACNPPPPPCRGPDCRPPPPCTGPNCVPPPCIGPNCAPPPPCTGPGCGPPPPPPSRMPPGHAMNDCSCHVHVSSMKGLRAHTTIECHAHQAKWRKTVLSVCQAPWLIKK